MHATPDIHKGIYPDLTLEELEDIVIKNTYEISY